MKTLLIVVAVLIGLYLIGSKSPAPVSPAITTAEAEPLQGPKVTVSGVQCIPHRTGTDMRGSVLNISSEPLQYVKVYGTFDGQVFDGYINDTTLQPGASSTFLLPGPAHQTDNCIMMYVRGSDGKRLN